MPQSEVIEKMDAEFDLFGRVQDLCGGELVRIGPGLFGFLQLHQRQNHHHHHRHLIIWTDLHCSFIITKTLIVMLVEPISTGPQ